MICGYNCSWNSALFGCGEKGEEGNKQPPKAKYTLSWVATMKKDKSGKWGQDTLTSIIVKTGRLGKASEKKWHLGKDLVVQGLVGLCKTRACWRRRGPDHWNGDMLLLFWQSFGKLHCLCKHQFLHLNNNDFMGWNLYLPHSQVEALSHRTSECDCIWRQGLWRGD